jgi:hypothetical protein
MTCGELQGQEQLPSAGNGLLTLSIYTVYPKNDLDYTLFSVLSSVNLEGSIRAFSGLDSPGRFGFSVLRNWVAGTNLLYVLGKEALYGHTLLLYCST